MSFLAPIKRGLNPKDEPCISKTERVTAIFVDQGMTKSQYLKIFKCQYLGEFLRYGPFFKHLVYTTIFKIVVYYNHLSGIFRSKYECKQIRRKFNFDHYSDFDVFFLMSSSQSFQRVDQICFLQHPNPS